MQITNFKKGISTLSSMAFLDYLNVVRNIQNPWLHAAIILGLFIIGAFILTFLIDKVFSRIARRTKTKVDDLIIAKSRKPVFFLVILFGLHVALVRLGLNNMLSNIVSSVGALVFVYILGAGSGIVIRAWGKTLALKTKSRMDETIFPLILKTVNIVFIIVAVLWVFNIWQVNITPYLAGLGISGLVIGLAFQDSLKNIFGGISLILDNNFNIGDKVSLETGELGEILDIGLRSTKLKTYDNEIIFIPNGQLANMRIRNYVQPNPRIRVVINFGVEYGTEIEKVKKVIEPVLRKIKGASDKPYMNVVFLEMADFALLFQARFWVDDYREAYGKKLEATEKIYDALNKAKIGIPFPTRTVYMHQVKER